MHGRSSLAAACEPDGTLARLTHMRRRARRQVRVPAVLTLVALLTACGSESGAGRECSGVGVRAGIGLDIEPPLAATVTEATMKICWDGVCRTPPIMLTPSSKAGPQTCQGTGPEAACGVPMVPTGGQGGFADVHDLPQRPVRVTVVLRDASGRRLLDRGLTVIPRTVYPDGPACGGGTPQAGVQVAGGELRERT